MPASASAGGSTEDQISEINGHTVYLCTAVGPRISTAQDAVDIIGQTWHSRADLVVIPANRFDDGFFNLSTGLAGEFIQKFANYEVALAIIGDIAEHLRASSALQAFVHESNRGRQVWFLHNLSDLAETLAPARPSSG